MNCCIGSLSAISEKDAINEAKSFKGLKGNGFGSSRFFGF